MLNPYGWQTVKTKHVAKINYVADLLDRTDYILTPSGSKMFKFVSNLQDQAYKRKKISAAQIDWLYNAFNTMRSKEKTVIRDYRVRLTPYEQQQVVQQFLRLPYVTAEALTNFIWQNVHLKIKLESVAVAVKNILGETPTDFRKRIGVVFGREE